MSGSRAWLGPALVAVIVALGLAGAGALIVLSQRDPGFGVEPDYYAKALAWDSARAELERSDRLGWTVGVRDDGRAAGGGRTIILRITDREGAALTGARAECEAFHNARSADRVRLGFIERAPGEYASILPAPRPGAWELRVMATREGARFLHTTRLMVGDAAGARAAGGTP